MIRFRFMLDDGSLRLLLMPLMPIPHAEMPLGHTFPRAAIDNYMLAAIILALARAVRRYFHHASSFQRECRATTRTATLNVGSPRANLISCERAMYRPSLHTHTYAAATLRAIDKILILLRANR